MRARSDLLPPGGPAWAGAEPTEGERSEPEGGAATAHAERGGTPPRPPKTEVPPRARRRTFTAEYKARVVREADGCTKPGQVGALLRREGLFSSHLVAWRRERERGALEALAPKRRGPRAPSAEAKRIAELERENRRLKDQLHRAQLITEAQKKMHELLGISLPDTSEIERS